MWNEENNRYGIVRLNTVFIFQFFFSVIVFLGILISNGELKAQNFRAGVIAGVSASQISGDSIWGFNKPGFIVGLYANRKFSPRSSLQFEMGFVQKGMKKIPHPAKGDYTLLNLNMNYIEVPVFYRWEPLPRLALDAGPVFGTLINVSGRDEQGTLPPADYRLRPFSRFEFAALLGINYRISELFDFNIRFTNSLIPVREHLFGQKFLFNRGEYNSVISFTLRFKFFSSITEASK